MAEWGFIKGLSLDEVFSDEKSIKNLKEGEYLYVLFEASKKSTLFIYDDERKGYSRFVKDTNGLGRDKTFCMRNPNHRDVFLFKIDGVLFPKQSKCDCAVIFGDQMAFIEFKTKAANKSEDTMEAHYSKIYNQLKITINAFESGYSRIGRNFRGFFSQIMAYGVFNPTVPANNATEKILIARFAKEVKMALSFSNTRTL